MKKYLKISSLLGVLGVYLWVRCFKVPLNNEVLNISYFTYEFKIWIMGLLIILSLFAIVLLLISAGNFKIGILKIVIGIILSIVLNINLLIALGFYAINMPIEGKVEEYKYNLEKVTEEEKSNYLNLCASKNSMYKRIEILLNKNIGIPENLVMLPQVSEYELVGDIVSSCKEKIKKIDEEGINIENYDKAIELYIYYNNIASRMLKVKNVDRLWLGYIKSIPNKTMESLIKNHESIQKEDFDKLIKICESNINVYNDCINNVNNVTSLIAYNPKNYEYLNEMCNWPLYDNNKTLKVVHMIINNSINNNLAENSKMYKQIEKQPFTNMAGFTNKVGWFYENTTGLLKEYKSDNGYYALSFGSFSMTFLLVEPEKSSRLAILKYIQTGNKSLLDGNVAVHEDDDKVVFELSNEKDYTTKENRKIVFNKIKHNIETPILGGTQR
ncbi:MAG TPA: hypothetical protein DEP72_02525 [Clostridiales bacterium]|nr:MAG: hypothetical protein A2Y18_06075 [Clostridiales bacterium GWD2_32_19]HCC07031.1 hypothetical protein [Clostridiales bacterium]